MDCRGGTAVLPLADCDCPLGNGREVSRDCPLARLARRSSLSQARLQLRATLEPSSLSSDRVRDRGCSILGRGRLGERQGECNYREFEYTPSDP